MESKILDIGVDMGFFNNRLNAQVDFFQRIRDGIPESRYDVLIPNEAGFSLPKENLRSDKHVGFDAMVNWTDHVSDFNYSVGANIIHVSGIGNNMIHVIATLGMFIVTVFGIVLVM